MIAEKVPPVQPALRRPIPLLACMLLSLSAVGVFAAYHLASTAFWYDESMQFWMSLGLDGFGPPHTQPGGFWAAIHNNALANLDPGGFTLILHTWLQFGTGAMWQRTLPFLFFLGGVIGLGWMGWSYTKSLPFALLCCAVPALFPLILDYSTEVRAYSMEFAGVVIGCTLLDRLEKHSTMWRALTTGIVFGFFLTARYSFVLFSMAAGLVLMARLGRAETGWSKLQPLFAFTLPLSGVSVLIVAVTLRPQYMARISYHGGELIQYLAATTAADKSASQIGTMLAVNLLFPFALPLTTAALLGALILLPRKLATPARLDRIAVSLESSTLASFCILCFAAIILTALVWRWHPWDIRTKWSLWLQALSAVAVVRFAASALACCAPTDGSGREDQRITALVVFAMLTLDLRLALYRRSPWPSFIPALTYLEQLSPPADSVAVDVHSYPTIRYFYEYGPLVSSRLYPEAFRLPYWNSPKQPISPQTRYLVTGLTLAAANRMFAPAHILQYADLPERLFRVEATAPTRE